MIVQCVCVCSRVWMENKAKWEGEEAYKAILKMQGLLKKYNTNEHFHCCNRNPSTNDVQNWMHSLSSLVHSVYMSGFLISRGNFEH